MAISLTASGIGMRNLGDFTQNEVFLTQSGTHIIKNNFDKKRIEFSVNLFQQTGDNADLAKWRIFLKTSITFDSVVYLCLNGFTIETLNDKNDKSGAAMKRIVFELTKKEV